MLRGSEGNKDIHPKSGNEVQTLPVLYWQVSSTELGNHPRVVCSSAIPTHRRQNATHCWLPTVAALGSASHQTSSDIFCWLAQPSASSCDLPLTYCLRSTLSCPLKWNCVPSPSKYLLFPTLAPSGHCGPTHKVLSH